MSPDLETCPTWSGNLFCCGCRKIRGEVSTRKDIMVLIICICGFAIDAIMKCGGRCLLFISVGFLISIF